MPAPTTFTTKEILELLQGKNDEALYAEADRVKHAVYGNEVFVRGIIENNNICARNCHYCGIRSENSALNRYNLTADEILDCARLIRSQGITSVVIQSGESDTTSNAQIADIVGRIKSEIGADVTLSLGEKPREVYEMWKEAGADRYLLKVETFQKSVYNPIHPGYSLNDRIKCVENLLDLGYQVGSGFIWGLPGYTLELFADDLLTLQKMGVHMYSTTPFVAGAGTPLATHPAADVETIYRALALYRLMAPKVNIPVTSACASLDSMSKQKGLRRGANVLMLSYTPDKNRKDYALYAGKNTVSSEKLSDLQNLVDVVQSVGQKMVFHPGRSKFER